MSWLFWTPEPCIFMRQRRWTALRDRAIFNSDFSVIVPCCRRDSKHGLGRRIVHANKHRIKPLVEARLWAGSLSPLCDSLESGRLLSRPARQLRHSDRKHFICLQRKSIVCDRGQSDRFRALFSGCALSRGGQIPLHRAARQQQDIDALRGRSRRQY